MRGLANGDRVMDANFAARNGGAASNAHTERCWVAAPGKAS